METSKWHFVDALPPTQQPPEQIFNEYADSLEADTKGLILGRVVERLHENRDDNGEILTKVVYVLYLVVPQLRNYSYRLLELERKNFVEDYPVNVRLFLKSGTHEETASTADDLDKKLKAASNAAGMLLTTIRFQVETLRDNKPTD